jgi:hypothetical protein
VTPPPSPGPWAFLRSAVFWTVAGVVVAVVAVLVTIYGINQSHADATKTLVPTSAPTSAPPKLQLKISAPQSSPAGGNISVSGEVTGLLGETLWIADQPADSPDKFVLSPQAVTTVDGPWQYFDREVGDQTDKGSAVTFIAIVANADCSQKLASVVSQAGDGEPSVSALPIGCIEVGRATTTLS